MSQSSQNAATARNGYGGECTGDGECPAGPNHRQENARHGQHCQDAGKIKSDARLIEPAEVKESGNIGIPLGEVKRVEYEVPSNDCAGDRTGSRYGKDDAREKTRFPSPANCTGHEKNWSQERHLLMQIQQSGSEPRDNEEAEDRQPAECDEA
jgi:hypothetical protein